MGGSKGGNQSSSRGNQSQNVWQPQGDALQGLYGNAENLWGNNGMYQGYLNNIAQNLGPYMQNIMQSGQGGMDQQLGGGAYGDTDQIRNQLLGSMGQRSNMGSMYESIVGGQGNTYIDPMVDAMKGSSMENLQRMQSGTGLDAAAMGQGGSNRHAMQNAMQATQMNQDMMDREMQMRGGAYDTDLQMKMGIAQQADQNRQLEQDRMMGMLGGANQSQQYGMGYAPMAQNLGMGSMAPWMQAQNQGWNSMNQYANTIGAPTVLGSGDMRGSSKGKGGGASIKG